MEITFMQGVLIAIAAALMAIDNSFEFAMLNRPLPAATITGIILGDPVAGLKVGALIELGFAGLMPVGGASVPHGTMAGIMGAVLSVSKGFAPPEALTLSLPFAYLMQYVNIGKSTFMSFVNPHAEKIASKGDEKGLIRFHYLTLSVNMTLYAVVAFLCAYAAQGLIGGFVDMIPLTLMRGLRLAGGLMPAVGFCMMLATIFKVEFTPFLLLGFVLSTYLGASTVLPIALIGASMGMIYYFFTGKNSKQEGEDDDVGI